MTILARTLVILGTLSLVAGTIAGVVNRQALDPDQFAAHVDTIRADPDVARELGVIITDRIVEREPALAALRPALESTSARMVASPSFGPVVQGAAAPIHRALTSGENDQIVLRMADIGGTLASSMTTVSPRLRAALPADLDVQLVAIGQQELTADIIRFARMTAVLAWLLPVLGVLLLVGAGAIIGRAGHDGVRLIARGVLAAAGVLALLLIGAGFAANRADDQTIEGALASAIWQELSGAFWTSTVLVAVAGILLRLVSYRVQTQHQL